VVLAVGFYEGVGDVMFAGLPQGSIELVLCGGPETIRCAVGDEVLRRLRGTPRVVAGDRGEPTHSQGENANPRPLPMGWGGPQSGVRPRDATDWRGNAR
jgi:hypothetical protein